MRRGGGGGHERRVESVVLIFRTVETGLVITLSLGLLCNCGSSAAISLVVEGFWVIKCHHVGNVRKRPISSGSGQ